MISNIKKTILNFSQITWLYAKNLMKNSVSRLYIYNIIIFILLKYKLFLSIYNDNNILFDIIIYILNIKKFNFFYNLKKKKTILKIYKKNFIIKKKKKKERNLLIK